MEKELLQKKIANLEQQLRLKKENNTKSQKVDQSRSNESFQKKPPKPIQYQHIVPPQQHTRSRTSMKLVLNSSSSPALCPSNSASSKTTATTTKRTVDSLPPQTSSKQKWTSQNKVWRNGSNPLQHSSSVARPPQEEAVRANQQQHHPQNRSQPKTISNSTVFSSGKPIARNPSSSSTLVKQSRYKLVLKEIKNPLPKSPNSSTPKASKSKMKFTRNKNRVLDLRSPVKPSSSLRIRSPRFSFSCVRSKPKIPQSLLSPSHVKTKFVTKRSRLNNKVFINPSSLRKPPPRRSACTPLSARTPKGVFGLASSPFPFSSSSSPSSAAAAKRFSLRRNKNSGNLCLRLTSPVRPSRMVSPRAAKRTRTKRTLNGHLSLKLTASPHLQKSAPSLLPQTRWTKTSKQKRGVNRVHISKKRLSRKISKKLCRFYTLSGVCRNSGTCLFTHDPGKVALCEQFLKQGVCRRENCALAHVRDPHRAPTCLFFLRGDCNRENCAYNHIRPQHILPVCQDFLNGYCPRGTQCTHTHSRTCVNYFIHGRCDDPKCMLYHPGRNNTSTEIQPSPLPTVEGVGALNWEGLASIRPHFRGSWGVEGEGEGVDASDSDSDWETVSEEEEEGVLGHDAPSSRILPRQKPHSHRPKAPSSRGRQLFSQGRCGGGRRGPSFRLASSAERTAMGRRAAEGEDEPTAPPLSLHTLTDTDPMSVLLSEKDKGEEEEEEWETESGSEEQSDSEPPRSSSPAPKRNRHSHPQNDSSRKRAKHFP
eukprot:GCRY01004231.1.p1 GENE.GCRY01004231.1~~GCRY01004231.1.p1  ORF type:complete len:760 (-),score=110.04 GCRY01004231.1:90-2369(-)